MFRIPPRPDWQRDAACRVHGPHLFFTNRPQAAKNVCADCPVVQQCAQFALADAGLEGVWGGMTAGERDLIRSRGTAA